MTKRKGIRADGIPNCPRVLIFAGCGIGDLILGTPLFSSIHKAMPGSKITVILRSDLPRDVLGNNSDIETAVHFPAVGGHNVSGVRRSIKNFFSQVIFIAGIRRRRFDISMHLLPGGLGREAQIAFLCGAKIRVGPAFKSRWNLSGRCFTHTIIWDSCRHAVENNLDNLRALGFTGFVTELRLSVKDEHRRAADDFCAGNNLHGNETVIGMHTGGASNRRLYWPASRFAEVARFIIESHKFRVAVFFGPGETTAASAFQGLPIIPVIGLRFGVVCGIIEKCAFFISSDTGLGHVAAALRKPTFTVFGNANQHKHHPWGNSSFWINKLPPSLFTGIETAYLAGEEGRKALESVTVMEVIERLDHVLKEIPTYVPRSHETR